MLPTAMYVAAVSADGWGPVVDGLKVAGTVLGAIGMALGLPGLLLFAIKEKRKNTAASDVAERTVDAEVAVKDTAADDARLLHAIAAFDAERASLERQLVSRDHELSFKDRLLEQKDQQLTHQEQMLERLRAQVESLLDRLADAQRELFGVRQELVEMTSDPDAHA
jgi:chromosome segregation ATPase